VSVLVLLEHDRGQMSDASWEALTAGRRLAAGMGAPTHAVLIGGELGEAAGEVAVYGADVVHHATHDLLVDYGPEAWGETLAQLIRSTGASAALATGTDRGNEVMAQAAARLDMPFVANCTVIEPSDVWKLTRVQWGGSLLEDATLTADVKLVSFGHHAVVAEPAHAPGAAALDAFTPELDGSVTRTMVKDRVVLTQGVTLATAPVVVSGGRGVGSADGFAILEELAAELGGVVGCSRAVTNNGWRPHSDQVGQTGTRIAPEIYIASGISGAIQHWVGAMASKKILAVNTDAEANMVAKADYAVIADLHEVIPAVTAEIRRRRGA
jgi:electron transfer flavoprotein alpha subunit